MKINQLTLNSNLKGLTVMGAPDGGLSKQVAQLTVGTTNGNRSTVTTSGSSAALLSAGHADAKFFGVDINANGPAIIDPATGKTVGYGAVLADDGGTISMTDSSITTKAVGGIGVEVKNKGFYTNLTGDVVDLVSTVNLNNTNITTQADQAVGAYVRAGGVLNLTNSNITTQGVDAHGVLALTSAVVNITGGEIKNDDGASVYVDGATATLTDVAIESLGNKYAGVVSTKGGVLKITRGTIKAESNGVRVEENARLELTDVTIETTIGTAANINGNTAIGVGDLVGKGPATVAFSGVHHLKTADDVAHGIDLGFNAVVEGDFTGDIQTTGKRAMGVASRASTFVIDDSTIVTKNEESHAVYVLAGTTTVTGASSGTSLKTDGRGSVGVYVLGGATANLASVKIIETAGADAHGVFASGFDGGAKVSFAADPNASISGKQTITTQGDRSFGVLLETGSIVNSPFVGSVSTKGNTAIGIQSGAANLAINNSTVTTTGVNAAGVAVVAGTTSVSASQITTSGADARGVLVSGGVANLTDSAVTVSSNATAIDSVSYFSPSTVNVLRSSVKSTGDALTAVRAASGGQINMADSTITKNITSNGQGFAIAVGAYPDANVPSVPVSTANVTRTNITSGDAGITTLKDGALNLSDSTIKSRLVGVNAQFASKANLTNINLETTGSGVFASAIVVDGDATVKFSGVNNLITHGDSASGLLIGTGSVEGEFSGNIVTTAANADAIVVDSSTNKALALKNATVSTQTNAVLVKKGDLAVTATDSIMTGDIKAEAGAMLDLTMVGTDKAKSVLTGAILNARDVVIDPSTWKITANSDAVNLTNDASDFRFVNADGSAPDATYSDFKTVTVNTYTGANDAHVYLNTRLNGDDVTGAGSDKIVVRDGGKMSGTTTFHFANAGGTGAATYDGIKFVDAKNGATVDKSNFKIANGYVAAGAYGYVGRQGQYTNLADKQSLFLTNFAPKGSEVDGNGFLNGGEDATPPKSEEVGPGNGTGVDGNFSEKPTDGASSGNSHFDKNGKPIADNGSTNPDGSLPKTNEKGNEIIYKRENQDGNYFAVPNGEIVKPDNIKPTTEPVKPKRLISPDFVTYNAAADVVSLSANTLLGTYHERMGAQNTPLIQAETSTSVNTNSWGRLVADTREVAYDNAAFNQSIQGETMGFQLGHSFWQSRNKDNALGQAGVAIGYVTGSMDVTGDFLTTQNGDAGSVDAQTTSLMAYYTLAANDGRYLDAVLQYSMSSADAQGQLSKLSLDGTGLRASLEVGKPVRLDSLTLEPQAQLIAYKDSFDDAKDSNGYVMSQADNSGVIFRVGARLTSNDTTAAFKPWFAANINLQNGSTTGITDKTNNVYESSEKDAKWADMSVGMSYQTSSDVSVYGHLKQSVAIGGGTNTTTSGAIGIQKAW